MKYMPEDVVMEILSRLPVRQLLSCKCVCKTWCALIKSSGFMDMHMALQVARGNELIVIPHYDVFSKKGVVSFYKYNCDSLSFSKAQADIDIEAGSYKIQSLDHCDGIIYISSFDTDILMNPVLSELKYLPRIPAFAQLKLYPSLTTFGIHDDRPIIGTGFGCDYAKRDYKVVRLYGIPSEDNDYNWGAYIYNLRTSNSWRKLEAKPTFSYEIRDVVDMSLFFKGLVHWVTLDMQKQARVLTFNMTTELFGEIQLPENMRLLCPCKMFVLDKSIAFCNDPVVDGGHSQVNVWVMKEYGIRESWTKLYSFSTPTKSSALSFWKNDKIFLDNMITLNRTLLLENWIPSDRKLLCYDLLTGKVHGSQLSNISKLIICIPSLVSIGQTVEEPPCALVSKKSDSLYAKNCIIL